MQQRNRQRTDHVRRCDSFNNGLKQELYYWTETVDLHHPAMEASTPRKQQKPAYGHHKKETSVGRPRLPRQSTADSLSDEVAQLRKLNGSSVELPSYQNLHRELLLSHKRGLLEEKPELTRVLEQRRLDLHREEELAQRRPSDLEMELRKRQQKMQEYEQEEIRRQENEQKIPEFIRVKDNLRRTQTFEP